MMNRDNNENIDLKNIKEIKKVFKEMKENKIYYPYFNGKNLKYAKRLKFLAKKQLDLSSEYDTYNNEFNRKNWLYCLDILNDNREIYYKYKDNLWFKSPFYPNDLKSFEIWYNRYLKMLEKL